MKPGKKLVRCHNCWEDVEVKTKINKYKGYKIRNGKVYCKACSKEIKE